MTRKEREEAIVLLRANVMVACDTSDKVGYGTPLNKAIEEALKMAIGALEQESIAEERYQDLVEYFGDKDTAKCILEDREEFKKWLERVRWNTRKVDELARKLEQKPCVTMRDLSDEEIKHFAEEMKKVRLQTMTQEPCEDAVSRKDIYFKLTNGAYPNETIEQFIDRLVKELKALPPVTPTRKKGKWIEERDDYEELTGWHCSNCYDKTGFVTTCAWDYCPNCGAEMEGGE